MTKQETLIGWAWCIALAQLAGLFLGACMIAFLQPITHLAVLLIEMDINPWKEHFWSLFYALYPAEVEMVLDDWHRLLTPHLLYTGSFNSGLTLTNPATPIYLGTSLTSIWLWLYAASGFLLKAARRFDIGFQWLHKRFDIDRKPLQAMGVVSGVLVMLLWWGIALVAHLIK